ncbi:MAG: diguanylate cyclase [Rubrobacter sp.]|nr:diguanylate cyclase [Rubrobacter sp.]
MNVLIAEDDAVSRMILQRAVQKLGHEVLVAEDGGKAWKLYCEASDIDVIISDWMMPEVDGLELCRKVRAEERVDGRGYTYFIFLTALGDREHLLQGLAAGADDYLSKPLDRDELEMRLTSALRVTELHRRLALQNEELEKLNRMLFEQSREDPLTTLGNRLRLREDLEVLRGRAKRYNHSYAVVLCDVDHFKAYNDRYGHLAGDDALQRVAETISACLRRGDTAYRYGGEEFLVVLPEQDARAAAAIAERLRRAVQDLEIPHEANAPQDVVTVSAGVAALSTTGDPDELLKRADAALYAAKKAGRNRVSADGND